MTQKQAQAIQNSMENAGNISQAMLKAGYSPATAKNPKELTQSKAWQEVMKEYLPDAELFQAHKEALKATKWNDFTGEREEDHAIRLRAATEGYKLKGYNLEDSNGLTINGPVQIKIIADKQLKENDRTPNQKLSEPTSDL